MTSEDFDLGNAVHLKHLILDIMTEYYTTGRSLRSIIREARLGSDIDSNSFATAQFLTLGTVRFQNTIDYILSRSMKNRSFKTLSLHDQILLRICLYWLRWHGTNLSDVMHLITEENNRFVSILEKGNAFDLIKSTRSLPRNKQLSIILSFPTFIVETLLDNMDETEAIAMMSASNDRQFAYLRLNRLLTDDISLVAEIEGNDVNLAQDSDFQDVFRIYSGLSEIIKTTSFKDRKILIHDKASMVAAKTLNPKPGDFVWDACAAPGMKTQYLWELMDTKGTLVATEINESRYNEARTQSSLMGMAGVDWLQADASRCPVRGANRILIDAPCTSTGMLHSHPSFKWRLNKKRLFSIMTIQNKILEGVLAGYSDSPGTEIVYATCSILPHEGESQIDSILEKFPVELVDNDLLKTCGYPGFECSTKVRRMFPHTHATDGFFIAKMRVTP